MLGGEVKELQNRILVPGQKGHTLLVFRAIFFFETIQGRYGGSAGSGVLNIVQIRFDRSLHLLGKAIQHIFHLIPTALASDSYRFPFCLKI